MEACLAWTVSFPEMFKEKVEEAGVLSEEGGGEVTLRT